MNIRLSDFHFEQFQCIIKSEKDLKAFKSNYKKAYIDNFGKWDDNTTILLQTSKLPKVETISYYEHIVTDNPVHDSTPLYMCQVPFKEPFQFFNYPVFARHDHDNIIVISEIATHNIPLETNPYFIRDDMIERTPTTKKSTMPSYTETDFMNYARGNSAFIVYNNDELKSITNFIKEMRNSKRMSLTKSMPIKTNYSKFPIYIYIDKNGYDRATNNLFSIAGMEIINYDSYLLHNNTNSTNDIINYDYVIENNVAKTIVSYADGQTIITTKHVDNVDTDTKWYGLVVNIAKHSMGGNNTMANTVDYVIKKHDLMLAEKANNKSIILQRKAIRDKRKHRWEMRKKAIHRAEAYKKCNTHNICDTEEEEIKKIAYVKYGVPTSFTYHEPKNKGE